MNRDRLASIRQKTPTEMNLSTGTVFESDTNWLVSQLDEAWTLLTALATSQYVHDRTRDSKSPTCPECREPIMYMPNDCETCNSLGGFVNDDSIAEHRKALAGEVS